MDYLADDVKEYSDRSSEVHLVQLLLIDGQDKSLKELFYHPRIT